MNLISVLPNAKKFHSHVNQDTSEWKPVDCKGNRPSPRYGHTAIVFSNFMWIFGGMDGEKVFNDVHIFNFETQEWREVECEEMPEKRYFYSAVLKEDCIYVFGGTPEIPNRIKARYFNDMWIFSFVNHTWAKIPVDNNLVRGRAGHISFLNENELYIYGGFQGDGGFTYLYDFFCFNLDTETWREIELQEQSPPVARPLSVTAFMNFFFVFGGFDGKNLSRTLWIFDPKEKKWGAIADLWRVVDDPTAVVAQNLAIVPRYGHSLGVFNQEGEDLLFIFGGSGSMFLNDLLYICFE